MKSLKELSDEIGEWAEKQLWSYQAPYLGFAEEIGELTHLILKKNQGIRPVPDFEAEVRDAVADAGVYLLHWYYMAKKEPVYDKWSVEVTARDWEKERVLGELFVQGGMLIIYTKTNGYDFNLALLSAQTALNYLRVISVQLGFDFQEQLEATWGEVSKRDWTRFPKNGMTE